MENFTGLFMLAVIGALAWYIDAYYSQKQKHKKEVNHE